ncbi:hypothetical protein L1D55_25740 [Vibrio sp. Isolate22]|uniref:hypothetical protein n=1 Tax=Vibrio sp. Isolate22 TaxID=2908532 RepID=UPI001EFEA87A|nr:hypothetical protein [Vibrio sp. Isolate22]MCG9695065.1 hypothetical protein [Vibrio sp. Isolate22]
MGDDIIKESPDAPVAMESEIYEALVQSKHNNKQPIIKLQYPLTARELVVPQAYRHPERHIKMTDTSDSNKVLLYQLIVAAYNYCFTDAFAAVSAKEIFNKSAYLFVDWLNCHEITNKYTILKEYERHRFDVLDNHGGYSVLNTVKTLFTYALDDSAELHASLSASQLAYLQELRYTKLSPNTKKAQLSLASYFGRLDWLRRNDVGIGNELYTTLASAKLTVNSLIVTVSTLMLESVLYKKELKLFFEENGFDKSFFSCNIGNIRHEKANNIGNTLYQLLSSFHQTGGQNNTLKNALDLVLLSNSASKSSYLIMKEALESQSKCNSIFLTKNNNQLSNFFCCKNVTTRLGGNLFSIEFLERLVCDEQKRPVISIEKLLFSWLMASLTVQPSDINKLNHDSFRMIRVGSRVAHIECEYLKSRAKVFHTTRSLSTRKLEGKALLSYLSQCAGTPLLDKMPTVVISSEIHSLTGTLLALLENDDILLSLKEAHARHGNMPLIFPSAVTKLLKFGIHSSNVVSHPQKVDIVERNRLVKESKTPCQKDLFGLQAIKNSAVHAFSDPYTLHYLINRNSHSNQTEKLHYLNEDNEEYLNACGRITREVMFDLINNVFDLGFEDLRGDDRENAIAHFNSEFMSVSETIAYKSGEMLSRLMVVTEQSTGEINEVGILALADGSDQEGFESIYVLDSSVTAWKMYNYLHEFKKNYKKLLSRNPDYLYKTAMPTVEWIEVALGKLSKRSQTEGEKLFKDMLNNNVEVSVFYSI